MKIAQTLIENINSMASNEIKAALEKKLTDFEFNLIKVESVTSELNGDAVVTFSDPEGEIEVLFTYDEDDGGQAIILDPEKDLLDDEEDELDIIELDALEPSTLEFEGGEVGLDMVNLGWLTEAALQAILTVGDLIDTQKDTGDVDNDDAILERSVIVVRGGKKVRLPLVRKRRRRRLTAKQKSAIRRGAKKRKAKKGSIARARKKSLKLRKRSNIKQRKKGSKLKVAGTSTSKNFRG